MIITETIKAITPLPTQCSSNKVVTRKVKVVMVVVIHKNRVVMEVVMEQTAVVMDKHLLQVLAVVVVTSLVVINQPLHLLVQVVMEVVMGVVNNNNHSREVVTHKVVIQPRLEVVETLVVKDINRIEGLRLRIS